MNERHCIICSNASLWRFNKEGVDYWQCLNCKTLFSYPIDNDNMVGGEFEEGRNKMQNHLRTQRVSDLTRSMGKKPEESQVLDFGCGHGLLIKDLQELGYNCDGFDAYNEQFSKLPESNKYDIITCIELIEHTSHPFIEIDVMCRALVQYGIVMIETSFVNVAEEEGIPLEEFHYVAAKNGHSTIFSHHGLDLIFALKGFAPIVHLNRHVRLYIKK